MATVGMSKRMFATVGLKGRRELADSTRIGASLSFYCVFTAVFSYCSNRYCYDHRHIIVTLLALCVVTVLYVSSDVCKDFFATQ